MARARARTDEMVECGDVARADARRAGATTTRARDARDVGLVVGGLGLGGGAERRKRANARD